MDRESPDHNLIMITGPGRSGTSALTGMLSMLGVEVPGPLVAANRSNERGFYETRWVVDFQRELLSRAFTYEFDGDPRSMLRVTPLITDEVRSTVTSWLRDAAQGHPVIAIKDPRSIWFHDLWAAAAERVGRTVGYLTTLRHPAEVAGSRTAYYGTETRAIQAREYAVAKVAGWVHISLLNERETRRQPRAYVRYDELIEDWRPVATRIEEELGLRFPGRPDPWHQPHSVDDFLSPSLRRITTTWDDLDCPGSLRVLAEQTWEASLQLAATGRDADTDAVFDDLSERYSHLYRDSAAIVADMASSRVERATARAKKKSAAGAGAMPQSPTVNRIRRSSRAGRLRGPLARVSRALPEPARRRLRRLVGRRGRA